VPSNPNSPSAPSADLLLRLDPTAGSAEAWEAPIDGTEVRTGRLTAFATTGAAALRAGGLRCGCARSA
jgi:hypothetical protein